jgi:hypothetical protein
MPRLRRHMPICGSDGAQPTTPAGAYFRPAGAYFRPAEACFRPANARTFTGRNSDRPHHAGRPRRPDRPRLRPLAYGLPLHQRADRAPRCNGQAAGADPPLLSAAQHQADVRYRKSV